MSRNLRTVIGIDEAGYGPLLGPLVVGISVFRIPGEGNALSARLPVVVDDSKKLFSRATGLGRLEEGVLAFREVAADSDVPDDPGERPPWGLPVDAEIPITYLHPRITYSAAHRRVKGLQNDRWLATIVEDLWIEEDE